MIGSATAARTPTGVCVAPTSYAKIEQAANDLRPLLPLVKARSRTFTIDAWRVLEMTLPKAGINYRIAETHELCDCAAFTIPEHNLVVVRSDVYDGLFTGSVFSRSTVVHEFSHIALGHAITLHRGVPVGQHEWYEDSEWQANALTAALMMPIQSAHEGHSVGTTLIIATWLKLAGSALAAAKKYADDRNASRAQAHRNELARDVGKLITGLILSGYAPTYPHLANLIAEFEALLARGAELPRDERKLVLELIEKSRAAADGGRGISGLPTYTRRRPVASSKWTVKKSAAKRPAAKKSAAKRPAAKKAMAKTATARKAAAKKSAARKAP